MATINQPKPTEPKAPSGDQQPLQPGGPKESEFNRRAEPKRPNVERPEDQREKIRGER